MTVLADLHHIWCVACGGHSSPSVTYTVCRACPSLPGTDATCSAVLVLLGWELYSTAATDQIIHHMVPVLALDGADPMELPLG